MARKPAAVSIDPDFYAAAVSRAQSLGMNWSQYVNQLIRSDMENGGPILVKDTATKYQADIVKRETTDVSQRSKKKAKPLVGNPHG